MKKAFFYIISFILTILVAVGAKADSFSSETLESTPEEKTILLAKESNLEESKNQEIKADFVSSNTSSEPTAEKPQTPQTSNQATITSSEIKSAPVENIPTFRVTDYISNCDNVSCFTSKDAERGVVQYQNTFYYGHSTIAFDSLKTVNVGQKIKVIDINGRTHTYLIKQRMVREKSYLNGAGKEDGFTAGIYSAYYSGNQFSAAFMTCGDGSNNNSAYRLILFATEI
ncbi:hypothetical protein IKG45_00885 [Candidatus Saccharibacteria bacterium]|nr:hypothetical protein [Candidatus Saccharibacteria bacterium]